MECTILIEYTIIMHSLHTFYFFGNCYVCAKVISSVFLLLFRWWICARQFYVWRYTTLCLSSFIVFP